MYGIQDAEGPKLHWLNLLCPAVWSHISIFIDKLLSLGHHWQDRSLYQAWFLKPFVTRKTVVWEAACNVCVWGNVCLELLGVGTLEGDCSSSSSCTPVIPADNKQGTSIHFLACLSGWWALLHRTALNELIGFPCLDPDPVYEKQWIAASYCVVVRAGNDSLRVTSRRLFVATQCP